MASNDYAFTTDWHVAGSPVEVARILEDGTDLPRWWPAVYLSATEVEPGEPGTRVGRVSALHTRGWLPYTLRWSFASRTTACRVASASAPGATSTAPASGR